jgi:Spy/CpxP family protein refolding chaperone
MSVTETAAASPEAGRKRGRLRRFFVGSALVAAGVIIGIGTSAFSQGYGPHRGWSDDGPRRHWGEWFDGPRWSRDWDGPRRWFDRDRDGPRGWFDRDRDGPRGWFGRDRDDDGPRFWRRGGHFGGGPFLTPGRIERMVDRLAWAVDASSEQKQKLRAIAQHTVDELAPLRERHLDGRRQMREVLAAPTIDRGRLEALRVEQMRLADEASRRIAASVADAADVLTPAQRAELARRLERFGPRRG